MDKFSVGFMSYARSDDEHENGRITQFCTRLSGEVRLHTGERFDIFQDRQHIAWGEQWKNRIHGGLDTCTLFFPIITASFFKSEACRHELERFLVRESILGRRDLIMPIYYVDCRVMNSESNGTTDRLAKLIAARHYVDWRPLRLEPVDSLQSAKMLATMAKQIAGVLDSMHPEPLRENCSLAAPACGEYGWAGSTPTPPYAAEAMSGRSPDATAIPANWLIIEDAFKRGDFAAVFDALLAAQAGDRLLVPLAGWPKAS